MWSYICEKCGARLDPGEKCDCSVGENRHKGGSLTATASEINVNLKIEIVNK